ncbi:MAG: hypothetical protein OXF73_08045 [Gammaproteobacteria bacterium]|nr:hypothetical protein [Gammaproteobacteria bacterium]
MQKSSKPLSVPHLRYRLCCLLLDCSVSMLRQHRLSLPRVLSCKSHGRFVSKTAAGSDWLSQGPSSHPEKPGQHGDMNEHWIRSIQGGGATPVHQGIDAAERFLRRHQRQFPGAGVDCRLMTDGQFRELPAPPQGAEHYTVIDFENERLQLARTRQIAKLWHADCWRMENVLEMDRHLGPVCGDSR